jgi:DNA-directed RNA polymerase subunit RPC12/RpoP
MSLSPPTLARPIALLTQHGKERVLAPVLEPALGARLVRVDGFDTDQLGTFTREIPRAGTQLQAARRKAQLAIELSGHRQGLGSEGSFGPDPMVGMFPWNVEVLVYLDADSGLELVGLAEGPCEQLQQDIRDWTELQATARAAGFPAQGLVLRPDHADDPRIHKPEGDWAALEAAYRTARAQSSSGLVVVEYDLRAHRNPARMQRIREAAENLAARHASRCPACASPGFWAVKRVPGLPCAHCGLPTRETIADVYACPACAHREVRERPGVTVADPGRCDVCNP